MGTKRLKKRNDLEKNLKDQICLSQGSDMFISRIRYVYHTQCSYQVCLRLHNHPADYTLGGIYRPMYTRGGIYRPIYTPTGIYRPDPD